MDLDSELEATVLPTKVGMSPTVMVGLPFTFVLGSFSPTLLQRLGPTAILHLLIPGLRLVRGSLGIYGHAVKSLYSGQ